MRARNKISFWLLRLTLIGITVQLLAACSWRTSDRPSFLVIAVEGLNSEAIDCANLDEEFEKGLGVLCAEGVRFTHAYTTSTQSQATMASILTGLYPKGHGVWHNGSAFLSEDFSTVSKFAIAHGYRTSLFSGGAPIWRKSGLAQGFEVFDDNVPISLNDFYRPARKNAELFLSWLNEVGDRAPFFSALFLPDLQFAKSASPAILDDRGRQRPSGFEGQIREINYALVALIQQLKKTNQWENTYVTLVGLNGQTGANRVGEFNAVNLMSENTQVLLLVKPARKTRDATIDWSIDANVSLADLGATYFDILGANPSETNAGPNSVARGTLAAATDKSFEVVSLWPALQKPQVTWRRDRLILSESAWPIWRGVSNTRVAVRQSQLLVVNDLKTKVFNSLTDRFERQSISLNEPSVKQAVAEILEKLAVQKISPWEGLPSNLTDKIILAKKLFGSAEENSSDELANQLTQLVRQRPWDRQLVGWLARLAIVRRDWEDLEKLGSDHFNPAWVYISKRARGDVKAQASDNCLSLIERDPNAVAATTSQSTRSSCGDAEFVSYLDYNQANEKEHKLNLEERFTRLFSNAETDEEIAKQNFLNSLNWDTQIDIPAEPRLVHVANRTLRYGKLPTFLGPGHQRK